MLPEFLYIEIYWRIIRAESIKLINLNESDLERNEKKEGKTKKGKGKIFLFFFSSLSSLSLIVDDFILKNDAECFHFSTIFVPF